MGYNELGARRLEGAGNLMENSGQKNCQHESNGAQSHGIIGRASGSLPSAAEDRVGRFGSLWHVSPEHCLLPS